ncbi:MAG: enoyl-CoA hydratase/isomerase family protein [Chloroflexi bacterium]|nr:enoyl-CoA hydratase/isomerase family protein [Chloroflexota bacterium]
MNDPILVDSMSPVATVTFNRPNQRNAISFTMWRQFVDIMQKLGADRDVRAIVITGAGDEAFSAGADIQDFDEYRSDSTKGRGYNDAVNGALKALSEMATPTISMIRGFAVGGGVRTGGGHRPTHSQRRQPPGNPGWQAGHQHWAP